MMRSVWRHLLTLLPPRGRAVAGLLALESLLASVLEAVLLVLVVATALAVAEEAGATDLSLPMVGHVDVRPSSALLVAGIAGLVMLGLHLHVARLTAHLSASVLHAARERAVAAFARASWERQASDREGALQETVSTLAGQTSTLVVYLSNFAASAIGLAALIAAALIVDLLVTLVVVVFGITLFLVLRPVGLLNQRFSRDYVDRNSDFVEQVSQWGTMAMELRVFGVAELEVARLGAQNRTATDAMTRSQFVSRAGVELYRDLAILFLVGAVAGLYLVGTVQLAAVGAVVMLVVRSLSYAQMTNSALQSATELSPNLEALQRRLASLAAAVEPHGTVPVERVTSVELEDVGYDYGPGRPGIDGVSLTIHAGEAIGVIGPSGGGKSTLVQVLLRLRPPTRGSIFVSGVRYEDIDPRCWHRLAALVPQEPKLFEGTVADNIAFLRPQITRAQVERAADQAHVLEDIHRLPDGFDTDLGPRGTGLSGGQKQRIAIARALSGDPQLLVLDEPTSALDARSEQLLQSTIESLKGQVTLVIIAHRMTTLTCCDRIVAMQEGRVKVIGSLQEALALVGLPEDATTPGGTDDHGD